MQSNSLKGKSLEQRLTVSRWESFSTNAPLTRADRRELKTLAKFARTRRPNTIINLTAHGGQVIVAQAVQS